MKLSIRLKKICDMVSYSKTVADVGCDHGKVVAQLFLDNKIEYAYLSDISAKSVKKADDLLKELNISSYKYQVIVTDGLNNYNVKDIDTVIIAGMGGLEIKKILINNNVDVKEFVLVPHNNDVELRKYLIKNNYKIDKDLIVKDANKYYNILKVTKGCSKLNKLQMYFGKTNFEVVTDDFIEYLDAERLKTINVLKKVPFMKKLKYVKYLKLISRAKNRVKRGV